jgi:hypothetical protein
VVYSAFDPRLLTKQLLALVAALVAHVEGKEIARTAANNPDCPVVGIKDIK